MYIFILRPPYTFSIHLIISFKLMIAFLAISTTILLMSFIVQSNIHTYFEIQMFLEQLKLFEDATIHHGVWSITDALRHVSGFSPDQILSIKNSPSMHGSIPPDSRRTFLHFVGSVRTHELLLKLFGSTSNIGHDLLQQLFEQEKTVVYEQVQQLIAQEEVVKPKPKTGPLSYITPMMTLGFIVLGMGLVVVTHATGIVTN